MHLTLFILTQIFALKTINSDTTSSDIRFCAINWLSTTSTHSYSCVPLYIISIHSPRDRPRACVNNCANIECKYSYLSEYEYICACVCAFIGIFVDKRPHSHPQYSNSIDSPIHTARFSAELNYRFAFLTRSDLSTLDISEFLAYFQHFSASCHSFFLSS